MKYLHNIGASLLTVLLLIGCRPADFAKDRSGLPRGEAAAEAELGTQLKINRDALFKGSTERVRLDAASVILFTDDPDARKILLEAMKQSESAAARTAVCRALSQAGTEQKPIMNKEDFIQPLFDILSTQTDDSAKLAAEALLIFDYEQVAKRLEDVITDTSLPVQVRLNAIYALRLQPDMRAIFKLIDLLDDPESRVAAEAESALRLLGTPVGGDAEARRQIRNKLKRRGRDEFFRDLLIRQEARMRQLKYEKEQWQERYLSALNKIYDGISNDAARGKFLVEQLTGSEVTVKLWALDKISQWRVGTRSELPITELGPILVGLISDQDRNIRLKTAKLLSLMGELNSAEKLLGQFKVEQDDEVRMELFVALGGACYYAFLPNSGISVSPDIRKQTLELAAGYLSDKDPKKAQKGAEAIKKLLEQNGLAAGEVNRYLGLLAERYKQRQAETDAALRGELLSAMAGLCAKSVYSAEAIRIFKPLFEESLYDQTDLVREAAVNGLVYIDKTRALKMLRKDFINDNSAVVRAKLIELAGEVGGQDDLVWLAEKIGTTTEGEPAWQAMLKIFKGSAAVALAGWIDKFDSSDTKMPKFQVPKGPDAIRDPFGTSRHFGTGFSDEQKVSFFEIVEQKAVGESRTSRRIPKERDADSFGNGMPDPSASEVRGEGKTDLLKNVRGKLAFLYKKRGEFEKSAEYWGMLREAATTPQEKEAILTELLDVYLKWPNVEGAALLVRNCLLEKDLGRDNAVVLSLDNYFAEPPAATDAEGIGIPFLRDPNAVLKALINIDVAMDRPMWREQLNRWNERFGPKKDSGESRTSSRTSEVRGEEVRGESKNGGSLP